MEPYLNKSGKKVAIVGSRSLKDPKIVHDYLDSKRDKIKMLVSGGADSGADFHCQTWSKLRGFPITIFFSRWHDRNGVYQKGAGFQRNRFIVENSDLVICFYDGVSKGSQNTMDICKQLGKPLKVITFTPEVNNQVAVSSEKLQP